MLRDHKTILFLAPCRVALNINVASGTREKPFYSFQCIYIAKSYSRFYSVTRLDRGLITQTKYWLES